MTTHRDPEPIEDYLDELLACLRLPPRATRRLLTETEDHLRCAADAAVSRGMDPWAAEREAVAAFGSARQVAAQAQSARRLPLTKAAGVLVWSVAALGGVGLVAVGLSGLVAAAFNAVAGRQFVGALPFRYPAGACAHFLAVQPHAGTCAVAAVWENSHDAVALRVAAGVLGLLVLVVCWVTRRWLRTDPSFARMHAAALAVTAAACFTAAAAWLVGMSLDTAVQYGARGVGWYLSGALVSLIGAAVTAAYSWRQLRHLRPWRHLAVE